MLCVQLATRPLRIETCANARMLTAFAFSVSIYRALRLSAAFCADGVTSPAPFYQEKKLFIYFYSFIFYLFICTATAAGADALDTRHQHAAHLTWDHSLETRRGDADRPSDVSAVTDRAQLVRTCTRKCSPQVY